MRTHRLTAIIEREGEARENLKEALELFFETASKDELKERLRGDIFVTQVEVVIG